MNNTDTMNREEWLNNASNIIRNTIIEPAIESHNLTMESNVKVAISIGHPRTKNALGEAWAKDVSEDKETAQIFITPFNNDSVRILDVLTHELIHAYDDNKSGHKGRFALLARAVGLEGKLTATVAGDALREQLLDIVDVLGDIPHTKLDRAVIEKPKQKSRMLKIECQHCNFVMRASRTQVERIAVNLDASCPCCNQGAFVNAAHNALLSA